MWLYDDDECYINGCEDGGDNGGGAEDSDDNFYSFSLLFLAVLMAVFLARFVFIQLMPHLMMYFLKN